MPPSTLPTRTKKRPHANCRPLRVTLLTPEERADVLARHEAMCWDIARQVWRKNLQCDIDDLVSEVRLAFVKCALTFDPSFGWTFATYAYRSGVRAALAFAAAECARGMKVPSYLGFVPHPTAQLSVGPLANESDDAPSDPTDYRASEPPYPPDWWDRVTRWLPWRERQMVRLHFECGLTHGEIGQVFGGITRSVVQQTLVRALARLRNAVERDELETAS